MSASSPLTGCCDSFATPASPPLSSQRRSLLQRRARYLAQGLVFYNIAEGVISIIAGNMANSSALIGFGLDAAVEVLSGLVIVWQFRHANPEAYERTAQRLIAVAFFLLAVYVALESTLALVGGEKAEPSPVGIALAIASVIIMPVVSFLQRRTGQELGSAAVVSDSKQVLLCASMSVILLVGLLCNAVWGWWWFDPAAGLIIALLALREGIESFRGHSCACTSGLTD